MASFFSLLFEVSRKLYTDALLIPQRYTTHFRGNKRRKRERSNHQDFRRSTYNNLKRYANIKHNITFDNPINRNSQVPCFDTNATEWNYNSEDQHHDTGFHFSAPNHRNFESAEIKFKKITTANCVNDVDFS